MNFPLLLNNPDALAVFQEVVTKLPEDCEVYIIGGAVRNALFYHHFGKRLRQRDYDQIATLHASKYLDYLRSIGFLEGGIVREDQIILYKALVPNPDPKGYDDSVVFDIHPVEGTTAIDNLKQNVGLSINGFAISMRDIFSEDWIERIIELPNAKDDLEVKQLRVNLSGYKSDPAYFFSVLRFMSAGFTPPCREEINLLLNELPKLDSGRFCRNVAKIYNYIGSEEKARNLADSLGIKGDVFNEEVVKHINIKI